MKSGFSIVLAALVLVATSGVGITKHFCGNRVASASILGDGGCTCGAMDDSSNCCHTEREFFQVDDDFSVASVQALSFHTASIVAVFVYTLSLEFDEDGRLVAYLNYKPPIPDRDIPVLMQSFLI